VFFNTVGFVTETLGEGQPVRGVSTLQHRFYVLRGNVSEDQIEVYDSESFRLLRYLDLPDLGFAFDIVVSGRHRCAYVSDTSNHSVHRVKLSGAETTHWPVQDVPACLSLTIRHMVLVTCRKVDIVKEFTTDGELLREVVLDEVVSPWHTVQLYSGEYVMCHGDSGEALHRVCLVDSGGQLVSAFGEADVMKTPTHMAVDRNEFVFVIDRNNNRVLLLSPSLTYVREVVSRDELGWKPYRLALDYKRRRLYVAVNDKNRRGDYTAGRVIAVDV